MAAIAGPMMTMMVAQQQASAMRMQGQYQKDMMDTNARLAEFNAKDAIDRGDKSAVQLGKKVGGMIGEQRADLAAQGIDVNEGSAAEVQNDTSHMGALDELTIKNNAWREAWGYRVQANNYTGQGQMAYFAGQNNANNTLLTGGLNAIDSGMKWASFMKG